MEETEVRDHSKAIAFVSNSSPIVEHIEVSTTQNITAKPSVKKNTRKRRLSNSKDETINFCCCNISSKVPKCLELSGFITVTVIVLMLFSIPIITHFVQVSQ